MKRMIFLLPVFVILFVSCSKDEDNSKVETNTQEEITSGVHEGKVIDKIDASNYTYLQVKENDKIFWIAVPTMNINKGENVIFSQFMEMKNFKSETLNKTFESVLFVSDAKKYQMGKDMPTSHPNVNSQKKLDVKIQPAPGGKTIAQIFSGKDNLKGKVVKVSGKVVKYNPGIMDMNWIHIQDGTGDEINFDLLITSNDAVSVGDVIVAEGTLALDKDFGAGYTYKVLLEHAKIQKQNNL